MRILSKLMVVHLDKGFGGVFDRWQLQKCHFLVLSVNYKPFNCVTYKTSSKHFPNFAVLTEKI